MGKRTGYAKSSRDYCSYCCYLGRESIDFLSLRVNNKKIHSAFLLFFCFLSLPFFAQDKVTDSLKKIIRQGKEDSLKVDAYNLLSNRILLSGNFDSSKLLAENAVELAKKINYKKGIANGYNRIGNVFNMKSDFQKSIDFYTQSIKIKQEINDKRGIAAGYNNIGNSYQKMGNYTGALKCHFNALKIREEIGDKIGISNSHNNIASVFSLQGNQEEALKNYYRAIKLEEEIGDKSLLAGTYLGIGMALNSQKKYAQSIEMNERALKIQQEFNDKVGIAYTYNNIGLSYCDLKLWDKALYNDLQALKMQEDIGNAEGVATAKINIGIVYSELKKYLLSEKYLMEALDSSLSLNILQITREANAALSDLYSLMGNYPKSLAYYKSYIAVRDSLLNEENTKESVRLQMNYEFDKKEAATKLEQEKKEAIAAAENRKQKIVLILVSGVLLLVFVFAVFAYRSFLQKKKANKEITQQKEIIEEKQKEILDSIYYARRIQRSLLPSGKYIERCFTGLKKN
jgi:tetratricopeptide (TPR) repeat protein